MSPGLASYAFCREGRRVARQSVALSEIDSFRHAQMPNTRIDHVSRPFHRPQMHARQILADDANGEELRPGKYGNYRRQERKPGNSAALHQIPADDVRKDQEPEYSERKADHAGESQRESAEPRHHVERVADKLA